MAGALLPFYPSLFQPAVEAEAQVWPVRIRYLTPDGGTLPGGGDLPRRA
jgi:hypothetical protein